jgi:hypothetical protein
MKKNQDASEHWSFLATFLFDVNIYDFLLILVKSSNGNANIQMGCISSSIIKQQLCSCPISLFDGSISSHSYQWNLILQPLLLLHHDYTVQRRDRAVTETELISQL